VNPSASSPLPGQQSPAESKLERSASSLADVLSTTRDSVQDLGNGAKCVYFYSGALSEYWHLADYVVSSRSSDHIILIPREAL